MSLGLVLTLSASHRRLGDLGTGVGPHEPCWPRVSSGAGSANESVVGFWLSWLLARAGGELEPGSSFLGAEVVRPRVWDPKQQHPRALTPGCGCVVEPLPAPVR